MSYHNIIRYRSRAGRGLRAACLLLMLSVAGSCIDEDLSRCPTPCTDVTLRYFIAGGESLDPAFGRDLHSLHTGFWSSDGLLHTENVWTETELPDGLTFSMTLPADRYRHIATANCADDEDGHRLFPDDHAAAAFTRPETAPDTIRAMVQPAFVGALQFDLQAYEPAHRDVPLQPVTARLEITLHHVPTLSDLRCHVSGTKAGYVCASGAWLDNDRLTTDATASATDAGRGVKHYAFYTFPTAGRPASGEAAAQALRTTGEGAWRLTFLSHCSTTGKTIRHTFTVRQPLYAGEVFRGTFSLTETGGEHTDVEGGLEVDTDWSAGGDHNVEM